MSTASVAAVVKLSGCSRCRQFPESQMSDMVLATKRDKLTASLHKRYFDKLIELVKRIWNSQDGRQSARLLNLDIIKDSEVETLSQLFKIGLL
jgi:hypothetical protein